MMAAHPPAPRPIPGTAEARIARFVAATDPLDSLVAGGFLDRQDGHYVAQELPTLQLYQTMKHSVCVTVDPDVDHFYPKDGEPDADWRRRRAQTVRDHCSVCPVRAACAELALRKGDTVGIRGGLTPEKLKRRRVMERDRLDQALAEDQRAPQRQQARIAAAREVQRLAGQYLGTSGKPEKRLENLKNVRKAVRHRDALVAAHRRDAGWTAAA
ncbi:WhiB family transcriptional regulator [Streptomyces sp. NPDC048717]|uniref:WhiB family transcriptional regulator n=1 Tax=Streptomyces sp. NPDC048717 TaxID=3154928 RepID=UPI003435E442